MTYLKKQYSQYKFKYKKMFGICDCCSVNLKRVNNNEFLRFYH